MRRVGGSFRGRCSAGVSYLLVLALALGSGVPLAADETQLRITAAVANVRTTPSTDGQVLFQAQRGETLRLVETSGDWLLVEASGGRRGYIFRTLAERVSAPTVVEPASSPSLPTAVDVGTGPVAIDHSAIGCVVVDQYPRLDACFKPDASVGRAQIHFRASDKDPWFAVPFKAEGSCYSTLLPKPTRDIKQFQYYVDVLDRGFNEVQRPATGPDGAYKVRVVSKKSDCDRLAAIATSVAGVTEKIVVSIAKDPAGVVLNAAGARSLESRLVMTGFSPENVVVSSTGAAPGGASSASGSGASTAGKAAAAGGGGAGKALLIVGVLGGGAAAAYVATRNNEDSGSGGGGSTPPSTSGGGGTQPGLGDVAFRLTWSTGADLDLYVQEPNGNVVYYANPNSSTGGRLDVDSNAGCSNVRTNPVENVFWPSGQAPRGNYVFWAQHFGCGPTSSFTLQVLRGVGGTVASTNSGTLSPGQMSSRFSFTF